MQDDRQRQTSSWIRTLWNITGIVRRVAWDPRRTIDPSIELKRYANREWKHLTFMNIQCFVPVKGSEEEEKKNWSKVISRD